MHSTVIIGPLWVSLCAGRGESAPLNAERERPRADVFWNTEIAQTILLQINGVLEPYDSPQAAFLSDAL
jgi:ABC-type Fe3+ transport system substrate-binding protein